VGVLVTSGGNTYIANATGTNHVPPNVSFWTAVTNTAFTLLVGTGANFSTSQVVAVGPTFGTISSISVDTIILTTLLGVAPFPGQSVTIDAITLTGAITAPTATNVVAVQGGYLKGVYVTGNPRTTIKHSYFSGWSQAIGLWYGASDSLVEGNNLIANYGYEDTAHTLNRSAIELYPNNVSGGRNRVIGNLVDGSTHNGFEIAQGEVQSMFIGNTVRNWACESGLGQTGEGMELTGQAGIPGFNSDNLLMGNTLFSNGNFACIGVSLGFLSYQPKVIGNQFVNFVGATAAYAINVGGASYPTISGNSINGCAICIFVNSTSSSQGIITGNTINNISPNIAGVGIDLASAGDGWLIDGNTAIGDPANGGTGVLISSGNQHTVTNNRLVVSGPIAATMNDGVVSNNYVLKNINNGVGAVRLVGASARNVVKDNTITNTPGYTISLEGTADYNIVTGNRFATSTSANGDVHITTSGTHNQSNPNCTNSLCGTSPTFTASGCTPGTLVGGATSGTFIVGAGATPCTFVMTMGVGTAAATTGWNCTLIDQTTPANIITQASSTSTTCTLSGTGTTSDVIRFSAIPY
jgi:hypothetical protein